jgi:hypothetical protein
VMFFSLNHHILTTIKPTMKFLPIMIHSRFPKNIH